MRLGKYIRLSRLLDIYGSLLTERQRTVLSEYVNEDLSLYEIGELSGISRQGVRDTLLKAEANLEGFEENLHLLQKTDDINSALAAISRAAESLPGDERETILKETARIADIIDFDTED